MGHNQREYVVSSLKVNMRLAIACYTLFVAAGAAVTATPLQQDPQILIDTGGDPDKISGGINQVQPCGSPSCVFAFINDTAGIVNSFTFQATINTGLSAQTIKDGFTCESGYFLSCVTTYSSVSGNLTYLFSGVNPPDGEEFLPETNEQEGIPPGGTFTITLQGWVANATTDGQVLYAAPPKLTNDFTLAPEPSALLTLGSGLVLLGFLLRRRVVR